MNHEQVGISTPTATFNVDKGIADVIVLCWKAGITTLSSCEDWGEYMDGHGQHVLGYAGIGFSPADAKAFIKRVGRRDWMLSVTVDEDLPTKTGDPSYDLPIGTVSYLWPRSKTVEVKERLRSGRR